MARAGSNCVHSGKRIVRRVGDKDTRELGDKETEPEIWNLETLKRETHYPLVILSYFLYFRSSQSDN